MHSEYNFNEFSSSVFNVGILHCASMLSCQYMKIQRMYELSRTSHRLVHAYDDITKVLKITPSECALRY
jgi:hypothetical protein